MLSLVQTELRHAHFGYIEAITAHATRLNVTATFSMGGNWWLWRAALLFEGRPFDLITPQKWKKIVGIPNGSDKDKSLEVARMLYPDAKVGKNHNKADALLMAHAAMKEKK